LVLTRLHKEKEISALTLKLGSFLVFWGFHIKIHVSISLFLSLDFGCFFILYVSSGMGFFPSGILQQRS
jgi:hypothetical protein